MLITTTSNVCYKDIDFAFVITIFQLYYETVPTDVICFRHDMAENVFIWR